MKSKILTLEEIEQMNWEYQNTNITNNKLMEKYEQTRTMFYKLLIYKNKCIKVSKDIIDKINYDYYNTNMIIPEIENKYHISKPTVYSSLEGEKNRWTSNATKELMQKDYDNGMTYKNIANKYGVDKSVVVRFIKNKNRTDISLKDKFLSRVEKNGEGCWIWKGTLKGDNKYGTIRTDGKTKPAHHVSYYLEYGIWPSKQINHKCGNSLCVRHDHLYDGTAKENALDRVKHGTNPKQKLMEDDVIKIYKRLENSEGIKDIAIDFNISVNTIHNIKIGRSWKHTYIEYYNQEPPIKSGQNVSKEINMESLRKRFNNKIFLNPSSGCCEWKGAIGQHGYGVMNVINNKTKLTHHVAWFLSIGEWPKFICHKCNNRKCTRFSHLYEGNPHTNMIDTLKSGNHPNVKILPSYIDDIKNSKESGPKLAKKYGIDAGAIYNIKKGKTWKHII